MAKRTGSKTQIERFKEAARELETDEDEARFDDRLKRIAKPSKPKDDDDEHKTDK